MTAISLKWHEDQLLTGRALLRGWLRTDNPFLATLGLYLICDLGVHRGRLSLVVVSYVCGKEGSDLLVRTPDSGEDWRKNFREQSSSWGHRRESTWIHSKQVVVTENDSDTAKPLPTADPRLMLHYGTLLEAVQTDDTKLSTRELLIRQTAADRLRAVIQSQFRAWRQVAPI